MPNTFIISNKIEIFKYHQHLSKACFGCVEKKKLAVYHMLLLSTKNKHLIIINLKILTVYSIISPLGNSGISHVSVHLFALSSSSKFRLVGSVGPVVSTSQRMSWFKILFSFVLNRACLNYLYSFYKYCEEPNFQNLNTSVFRLLSYILIITACLHCELKLTSTLFKKQTNKQKQYFK